MQVGGIHSKDLLAVTFPVSRKIVPTIQQQWLYQCGFKTVCGA